ncbi:MAG: YihY family inner membrane protein [Rhodospirillaceae bacterium]|nr:YihY family inner membrane protein [Rhodospirillaceae bacterium]
MRRLYDTHISSAAAALSYSTTLAVVPALALVLASLAAFPAFNGFRTHLQDLIINNLVPDTGMQINQQLGTFIDAAGKLTAVGAAGLGATAILLLLTIEGQLNLIFGVSRPRPVVSRILVLWAVLTLGPLLLGVGVSLLGTFSTLIAPGTETNPALAFLLGHLAPTLITWGLLTFIYDVVPHDRVHWKDAMVGAAWAAVLLAALRYTFAFYIKLMTSYQAIYGAIAAVPVFLVWVYFVWYLVMAGAVISAGLPDWRLSLKGRAAGPAGKLLLGLEIIGVLAQAQRGGQGREGPYIARLADLPEDTVTVMLESLQAGHFVVCSDDGKWVLSRDLDATPLSDLVHHFGIGLNQTTLKLPDVSLVSRRLERRLSEASESERRLLSISLARILAPDEE